MVKIEDKEMMMSDKKWDIWKDIRLISNREISEAQAENEKLRAALIKVNEHIRQGETAEAGVEIDLALNGGDDA